MTPPSLTELLLLALVGLIAGAVNTVAGAGSLLLLPVLIWTGLPADAANATNRVGILAQSAMAVLGFQRSGLRVEPQERWMLVLVMAGGVIGALVASVVSPDGMELAIVLAMAGMLVVSLLPSPTPAPSVAAGQEPVAPAPALATSGARAMLAAGVLTIGVYGGFLQAGVGILLLLVLARAGKMGLIRANVFKSYATFGLAVMALAVFSWRGVLIDLPRGLALAVGSSAGGLLGARATMRLGPKFVGRAVTVAIALGLGKMVLDRLL